MKRLLACCAMLALLAASSARSATSIHVGVNIGNAPPPPQVVFESRPHFAYVPAQRVYVIDDPEFGYDMFRYGNWYYVYNDGWWYRAHSYRGPYAVVRTEYVPRGIFAVSDGHYRWRQHPHGMPPGQAKKMIRERGDRGEHGDRGDRGGHGNGNGRGRH